MPTAGDTYRAIVHWVMPEQVDAVNVLGLKILAGTCTDAELMTTLATYLTTAYAFLQTFIHDQVDIADAKIVKVVWSGTAWVTDQIVGTIFPTFTATVPTDMLPHACSAVVTMPTAVPKRRGRIKRNNNG